MFILTEKRNMSSNVTIDDADLKSRLAHFGINAPITNTTRKVLFNKLKNLEMNSQKNQTTQSDPNCELMVSEFTYSFY